MFKSETANKENSAPSTKGAEQTWSSKQLSPFAGSFSLYGPTFEEQKGQSWNQQQVPQQEVPRWGAAGSRHRRFGTPCALSDVLTPSCLENNCAILKNTDGFVYSVRFKRSERFFLRSTVPPLTRRNEKEDLRPGTVVRVEADRGMDIGTLAEAIPLQEFVQLTKTTTAGKARLLHDAQLILGPASKNELDQMCEKTDVEREAVLYIQTIVEDRQMPLVVVDVEFQFDRHKLVVYFESVTYVHFHHLVREIYKVYKTRIWLEQVGGSGSLRRPPTDGNYSRDAGTREGSGGGGGGGGGGHRVLGGGGESGFGSDIRGFQVNQHESTLDVPSKLSSRFPHSKLRHPLENSACEDKGQAISPRKSDQLVSSQQNPSNSYDPFASPRAPIAPPPSDLPTVSPEYLTPGGDQDENFLRAFSPGKGPLFSSEMVESPIASPTPTTAERLDPTKMVCPITQEIMDDPVTASDGINYDRRAIEAWLKRNNFSPLSHELLDNKNVTPNHALRLSIEAYRAQQLSDQLARFNVRD